MTEIPYNLERVIREGILALRVVEAELSAQADASADPGPILLELRDVRGLADRLGDTSVEEWQDGWGNWFNSQDVAVLRELATSRRNESPYEAEQLIESSHIDTNPFGALAAFLEWYQDHKRNLAIPEGHDPSA